MHELRSADPPTASPSTRAFTPVPAEAHAATLAPPRRPTGEIADSTGNPDALPSRLRPFIAYGSTSLVLFVIAAALRGAPAQAAADASDYGVLGACLSGVAAAIYGCVTLSRALRRRARTTKR